VARILAEAVIEELGNRDLGEPEGGVELAVREQAAVGGDPGTVEFELDPAVESGLASPAAYPTITPRPSPQAYGSVSKIGRERHQTFDSSGESGPQSPVASILFTPQGKVYRTQIGAPAHRT
jgi:hypothetical protein